ncbi:hypothetical protein PAESOLCIP111_01591 [Paenibacillus solanacearum]|uniref:Uncharacterized protein n=1 Tax=Paenibacillus solanacearum TaxID=2048548 RepID=A0A916JY80_9BACL|nr:hypothetical protein PAESOLCIP111_01591 [Paenibacillus solanacearum]
MKADRAQDIYVTLFYFEYADTNCIISGIMSLLDT